MAVSDLEAIDVVPSAEAHAEHELIVALRQRRKELLGEGDLLGEVADDEPLREAITDQSDALHSSIEQVVRASNGEGVPWKIGARFRRDIDQLLYDAQRAVKKKEKSARRDPQRSERVRQVRNNE
jgi:hypothetical protein